MSSPSRIFLLSFVGLLLFACSSTEASRDNINSKPDAGKHDDDTLDVSEVIDEDIEEDLGSALQVFEPTIYEGMVEFSWSLPEDNRLSEIHIIASPPELMWGEAERILEPTTTEYLFDGLVNGIHYTFEIKTFSDDGEIGESTVLGATPFSRPLLAASTRPTTIIDSVTKEPTPGWESIIEQGGTVAVWSPDGTKLFANLPFSGRCALFDRATRQEIPLQPSEELNLCIGVKFKWSPDSRYVAFIRHEVVYPGQTTTYSVLDTKTGEIDSTWPGFENAFHFMMALDWSPDGERLALSTSDGINSARLIMINTDTREVESGWPEYPDLHLGVIVQNMQWSPDSKRLGLTHIEHYPLEPGYVVFNTETKEVESDWPELIGDRPYPIVWSPDGELLILGFSNNLGLGIQAINTITRENEPGWPTDWSRIRDIAWSHDSQLLAIASEETPYVSIVGRALKDEQTEWTPISEWVGVLSWSAQREPPSAPTEIELSRRGNDVHLSWTPPEDPQILDYRITIEPSAQVAGSADYLLLNPTATEHLIDGLNPEVDYTVSIRPISVFGVGEPATLSTL